jgi:predicted alpha/beta hydrolase family esterase
MAKILFVHGGGDDAYSSDKTMAERLEALLGPDETLDRPHFKPLEQLDWPGVAKEVGAALRALPAGSIVVAHSLGASAAMKLLAEGVDPRLAHLFMLAAPYEGQDGEWPEEDFAFEEGFEAKLPKKLPITICHSEDDEVMPVSHAHQYAAKLPKANLVIVDGYGHEFTGPLDFLAEAIRKASR